MSALFDMYKVDFRGPARWLGCVDSYDAAAYEIELNALRAPGDYAIVNRQTAERTDLSFGLSVDGRHDHVTPISQQASTAKSEAPAMKKLTDPEAARRARVRQLFTARHPEKTTEDDVFLFFKWLQQHHQEMLPQGKHSDPYSDLRADLDGLYRD